MRGGSAAVKGPASKAGALLGRWESFWLGPVDLLPLSVFRAAFGTGVFFFYAARQWDYAFLFTESGVLPAAALPLAFSLAPRPPIPLGGLAVPFGPGFALHTAFLALLLGLALGVVGRRAAWLTLLLHLVFHHRNPLVVYGPDQVATCWLLYLCLARTDGYLAVPVPWKARAPRVEPGSVLADDPWSAVAVRFFQIHLCVMYAYSGLHKMRGQAWWRGDALWNALANGMFVDVDLGFLRHAPWLVALASSAVVLWEIYFPALVWIRPLRGAVLAAGALMHLGIGLLMNLGPFSWFMICPYVFFLDTGTLRRWIARKPHAAARAAEVSFP